MFICLFYALPRGCLLDYLLLLLFLDCCGHYFFIAVQITACFCVCYNSLFARGYRAHIDIIQCTLYYHYHSLISSLFIISIYSHHNKSLGNIGSGKTTLLTHVRELLQDKNLNQKIIFLKEPVDVWETIKDEEGKTMLEKFYADQEKYSFAFQMMVFIFLAIHQTYHSLAIVLGIHISITTIKRLY